MRDKLLARPTMWIWLAAVFVGLPAASSSADASTAELAARTRDGMVLRSELEEVRRYRAKSSRGRRDPHRDQSSSSLSDLEQLVVWKVLAERAVAEGLDRELQPALELESEILAENRLRLAIEAAAQPSETQIQAYYDAHRDDFARPKRWQLSNLLKKVPRGASASERQRVRQHLELLGQRLDDGADFAELARQESDASNRQLGGRAGMARLADLRPEVAAGVATLDAGQRSEVIETEEGFLLLFCHRVLEAEQTTFEKAQTSIRRGLKRQAFQDRWQALSERLLTAAAPVFELTAVEDPQASAVRFTEGDLQATISSAEVRAWHTRKPRRPRQPTSELSRQQLEERLLLRLRAKEAKRRGLLEAPEAQTTALWRRRQLLADALITQAIRKRLKPVSETEVTAFYQQHQASFVEPEASRVRAVRVRLDPTLSRDVYRRLEESAELARRGEIRLEAIPSRVDPKGRVAELLDLGELTARRLAAAGIHVKAAVEALTPGEISPVIQEGNQLWVLELLERREAQPIARQDAEARIRRRLERVRRAEARRVFEQEVIAAQEIVEL